MKAKFVPSNILHTEINNNDIDDLLLQSIKQDLPDLVKTLISIGANIHDNRLQILDIVINNKNYKILKLLLDKGLKIDRDYFSNYLANMKTDPLITKILKHYIFS